MRNSRGAVHETASDLHDADLMDRRPLRKFNELFLASVCSLPPDQIRAVRERGRVSWAVFALYLNVSTGLISQDELAADMTTRRRKDKPKKCLILEGEKDVDAAREIGLPATTNSAAGKRRPAETAATRPARGGREYHGPCPVSGA